MGLGDVTPPEDGGQCAAAVVAAAAAGVEEEEEEGEDVGASRRCLDEPQDATEAAPKCSASGGGAAAVWRNSCWGRLASRPRVSSWKERESWLQILFSSLHSRSVTTCCLAALSVRSALDSAPRAKCCFAGVTRLFTAWSFGISQSLNARLFITARLPSLHSISQSLILSFAKFNSLHFGLSIADLFLTVAVSRSVTKGSRASQAPLLPGASVCSGTHAGGTPLAGTHAGGTPLAGTHAGGTPLAGTQCSRRPSC